MQPLQTFAAASALPSWMGSLCRVVALMMKVIDGPRNRA